MSTSTTDPPNPQKLATISAEAAKEYAHKNYSKAAELYATAAELQALVNGEENPQNADLLYLYGRSLYHCGLEKSDVLGTGVGNSEAAREKKRAQQEGGAEGGKETGKGKGKAKRKTGTGDEELKESDKLKKGGVFSFQGDDNYDVDDDEDYEDIDDENTAGGEGEGEGEEDDDDFTLAWNILDLARVFFNKRLEAATEDPETLKKIKERLADACVDLEESLKIKLELYPTESTLITEAHYKLSLALEFASQGGGEGDADNEVSPEEQKKGRDEAVKHMKSAIASCKKRVEAEETAIKSADGDKVGDKPKDEAEKSVEEGKDLVKELELRLRDLMTPPQSTKPANLGEEQMAGILSSIMSGSSEDAKKMFENIISGANDISGSVRKKPKAPEAGPSSAASGSGTSNGAGAKRKAEDDTPVVQEEKPVVAAIGNSKKPRVTTEEEEKAAEEGTLVP
ncbi:hypothetical protein TWF569_005311 [Orbilia oligospora]|uniref:Tetratricopeptide SHNi-TPR domain-containing protein n=1 Tax=Orbilia oligospora TaxID=2813651 RepID=A0A7C8P329_ORBOL|nr:hypothetical protein TWF703_007820 [Orbilia oligospora]KAF3148815.1 hypothetical protein TWF569_005311 [Orbilia oligospora]